MGDGTQEYKKRFNGINQLAFDGFVTRPKDKYVINNTRMKLAQKFMSKHRHIREFVYKILKIGCNGEEKMLLRKYLEV